MADQKTDTSSKLQTDYDKLFHEFKEKTEKWQKKLLNKYIITESCDKNRHSELVSSGVNKDQIILVADIASDPEFKADGFERIRVIKPMMPITMDYWITRMNINLDDQGRVTGIYSA
ncbi:hypothetical protein H4219_006323 [Mycoemilia scoparia]|uniref:Uncharacterized protein n=1 Tax=Mycoemilia scoparia TaxID=417184 RepID=A0A9W8DM96_9FUNG|nr:hypothetical protein H4219_006323 [Mycoemilia scoparia]